MSASIKNALQFSGGIDSLATLWTLREQWDDLHVFWLNTGAAYEDTIKYMGRVKRLVPHFHEIQGVQPFSIAMFGWPADVVPVHATRDGRVSHSMSGLMFQPYIHCCARSIWEPLRMAMIAHGATHIYRGQRSSDKRKAPIKSGFVDEFGVTYLFPIESWTREEVFAYCRKECPSWIPPYYADGEKTSHDCWNCTAYLDENIERINALPTEQRDRVVGILGELRAEVARATEGVWE